MTAAREAGALRVGMVPVTERGSGGIYQYSHTMLEALAADAQAQVTLLVPRPLDAPLPGAVPSWPVVPYLPPPAPPGAAQRLKAGLRRAMPHWLMARRDARRQARAQAFATAHLDAPPVRAAIGDAMRSAGVEFVIYPSPNPIAFEAGLPYIMAIHDLQHRLQPEFPEVSAGGEWEMREYIIRNGARRATLLLADSQVGKEDILAFYGAYGVTEDRVKVLPFLPASYLDAAVPAAMRASVRATYALPPRYLFYPAQFWPHKNHRRIVEALMVLQRTHGVDVPVVFAGSQGDAIREAAFAEVRETAHRGGVSRLLHTIGYVPDAAMSALYAEAAGLVMPTFFGPTNIPILEAWGAGCPVITSDLRGIREQAGDAAVLVDPRSVESIAAGILRVWTDAPFARELAARGHRRLREYTAADYRRVFGAILQEAKARVQSSPRA